MVTPTDTNRLIYQTALPLISKLPKKLAYPLAARLGARHCWQQERDWVIAYRTGLKQGFPEANEAQLDRWTRQHFGMLARERLDSYYLPSMTTTNIRRWALLDAADLLDEPASSGKIIIMSHFGRPIMLSSALGLAGLKTGMLSQVIDERNPHLDEPTRQFLQFRMAHTVRLAGGRWITTADHLRVLYEALKHGETIIIMMDLVEPDASRQIRLPFLSGQIQLPPGIVRIAQRVGAQLYYGSAMDVGLQTACTVRRLHDDPASAMQQAVQQLQADTLQAPWQWWQWNNFQSLWSPT